MRRMRDLTTRHYVAITVPALAAVFGIQYFVRHHRATFFQGGFGALTMKSSQNKGDAKGARKPASSAGEKDRDRLYGREATGGGGADGVAVNGTTGANGAMPDQPASIVGANTDQMAADETSSPSAALEKAANEAASVGAGCSYIEYRGDGLTQTKVTKAEWVVVMSQFHGAKDGLLGWLQKNKSAFSPATIAIMDKQVRGLKIQRPPAAEEPDLAWRGIGVYSTNTENDPILKIGGGFVKLALNHPARAKFEMSRLVSQAWAPCELQRLSAGEVWNPLLKCLGISESQSCGVGTYSESGWAVSSTMGASISPPGCKLPVFQNPEMAKCLKKIPLPVALLEAGAKTIQVAEAN